MVQKIGTEVPYLAAPSPYGWHSRSRESHNQLNGYRGSHLNSANTFRWVSGRAVDAAGWDGLIAWPDVPWDSVLEFQVVYNLDWQPTSSELLTMAHMATGVTSGGWVDKIRVRLHAPLRPNTSSVWDITANIAGASPASMCIACQGVCSSLACVEAQASNDLTSGDFEYYRSRMEEMKRLQKILNTPCSVCKPSPANRA